MASFESNVLDRWSVGTKLGVFPRLSDVFRPGGLSQVTSVTVPKDGVVKLSSLDDDAPYWLSDGVRSVAFTAKSDRFVGADPFERRSTRSTSEQVQAERDAAARLSRGKGLQSAAPGRATSPNVITGARGTVDIKARHQSILTDQTDKRTDKEAEPQPAPSQIDVHGVPQRSDTAFGEATPKDVNEIVPRPSQDDVSDKTLQRSSTEFGEATPKPSDEVEPAISQEDSGKIKQRSDTELGSIEPKPTEKGIEAKKERDSSSAKARGATPAKPSAKTSKKDPIEVKGTKKDR